MIDMSDLNISHSVLFYGITTLGAVLGGVIAYLYRRIDQLRSELEDKIPSKGEINALTNSINAVSSRLDSLYQALAGHTIKSIAVNGNKKKRSRK